MEAWRFLAAWNETVTTIANVVIALGTIMLAVGIPYSIRTATRNERETLYATLDRTYFDIQKLIIDHPHLAQTDCRQKTADQVTQYKAFAYTVWNFLETVRDFSKDDKSLAATWDCVVRYEARAHAAWFQDPENRLKFKHSFIEYVEAHHLLKRTDAGG